MCLMLNNLYHLSLKRHEKIINIIITRFTWKIIDNQSIYGNRKHFFLQPKPHIQKVIKGPPFHLSKNFSFSPEKISKYFCPSAPFHDVDLLLDDHWNYYWIIIGW